MINQHRKFTSSLYRHKTRFIELRESMLKYRQAGAFKHYARSPDAQKHEIAHHIKFSTSIGKASMGTCCLRIELLAFSENGQPVYTFKSATHENRRHQRQAGPHSCHSLHCSFFDVTQEDKGLNNGCWQTTENSSILSFIPLHSFHSFTKDVLSSNPDEQNRILFRRKEIVWSASPPVICWMYHWKTGTWIQRASESLNWSSILWNSLLTGQWKGGYRARGKASTPENGSP